jgi:hypothetical protein
MQKREINNLFTRINSICKSKHDTIVEYTLKDINNGVGVSEDTGNLPDNFKSFLPGIKEIEAKLEGSEE